MNASDARVRDLKEALILRGLMGSLSACSGAIKNASSDDVTTHIVSLALDPAATRW